jgi:lipid II:glycine glycyltransferase (peptidoglycan interpeptide bridge formation enzyme)
LDLRSGAAEVFRKFHKDCVQRKIRRAERERIFVTAGTNPTVLAEFYHLMVLTRRRHGLPPQPLAWFRNLTECLGESLAIWVARKDDQPVAAIVTGRHGRTLTYKYGASDARFHQLGAMPCLFWSAIQDGIGRGLESFDLGRSDEENPGLLAFKDHLGATRSTLSYWTAPADVPQTAASGTWKRSLLRQACARLPDRYLAVLGGLLYRHIA